jgi:hypothetical protein
MIRLGKIRSSSVVSKSKVEDSKANDESEDAVGMCSGSGRLAADVDEKGRPVRETRVAVTVAVRSSKVVFIVYGVVPDLSSIPSVQRPGCSDARCLGVLHVDRLPVSSSLCLRADPHPAASACLSILHRLTSLTATETHIAE